MKRLVFLITAMLFFCCGCSPAKEAVMAEKSDSVWITDKRDILPIFYEDTTRPLATFEPKEGCMLGASVTEDPWIEGNWEIFEEVSKKEHHIYERSMTVGEDFPLMWALECYTKGRIPMVSLYPENMKKPFQKKDIEKAAEKIGTFQVPVLLRLYPNPSDLGTAQEYQEFFRYASAQLRKKAPNAVVVWSIPFRHVDIAKEYYPGDKAVDWIGLDILQKSTSEEELMEKRFEMWYYLFQKKKPLMISRLGISHYSTKDSTYTENATAKEITDFYASLQQYPAVKAVVYFDINFTTQAQQGLIRENYVLTESADILEAYQKAIASPWLSPQEGVRWLRSPYRGYLLEDKFYIPKAAVENDLQTSAEGEPIYINGEECYFLGDVAGYRIGLRDGCLWLTAKP